LQGIKKLVKKTEK